MDAPYTLLTLPQPLDTKYGKAQCSPVFALHGSRKRKREELVVGIDGEAVNVYKSQTLQTAYAIPPTAYLCCPPVSVHTREAGAQAAQRDTFVIFRDGPSDRKRRLVRFQEKLSGVAEFTTPVKRELTLPEGDIRCLHALPSQKLGSSASPQALVTYNDGAILCIAEDMSRLAWREKITRHDETVEALFLEDAVSAQRGLLRSREDIVALLQVSEGSLTSIACFIIRTADSVVLRLCSISSGAAGGSLQQLDDIQIRKTTSKATSQWELSAGTGQLCHLHNGILDVYDLTGIAPRASLTIRERGSPFIAFKHISASLVLTTTPQKAMLHDLQYGSVQGSVSFDGGTISTSRKRKREEEDITTQGLALHWFSDLNTVIASTTVLVGLPLSSELQASSSSKIRLASVVGKSAAGYMTVDAVDERFQSDRESWRKRLEAYIEEDDVVGLEREVAIQFGIDTGLTADVNGFLEHEEEEAEMLWDLDTDLVDLGPNQKPRAMDLLQAIFQTGTASPLRLRIRSRNILRWLFTADMVTDANLGSIFATNITVKDIATALIDADPSFLLMQDVLLLSLHLPVQFSVEGLRLLIRSLDTTEKVNGTAMEIDLADDEVDHEADAAEEELSNALLTLQSGLEIRSTTMQLLFGRLHAFPKKALTKALHQGLQLRDLVFFVHLLRLELAQAGWTRPYVGLAEDEPASSQEVDEEGSPSNDAIRTIGNLMVAAVDAIGPAGWLVGLNTDENEQLGLLDALQAEIGASLEGVYEAQALQAYLDDFERLAMSLGKSATPAKTIPQIEVQVLNDEAAAYPLGGRSTIIASKRTQRKDFSKQKQKSTMVGQYQFERIRV